MKSAFSRFAPVVILAASSAGLALHLSPVAAQTKNPPTLSFDMTANVRQAGSKTSAQAVNARVRLRGDRARVESQLGQQNVVMLLVRPYVYRLLPSAKAGVRYKSNSPLPEMNALGANWQTLMNQPQQIRAALQKKGARKTGSAVLSGTRTDIYSASKWDGQSRKVKLWIRQTDSLPLRMETSSGGMEVTVNWKNYRRGHALSPSLFVVPKGYRIRDGQPPQQMPL